MDVSRGGEATGHRAVSVVQTEQRKEEQLTVRETIEQEHVSCQTTDLILQQRTQNATQGKDRPKVAHRTAEHVEQAQAGAERRCPGRRPLQLGERRPPYHP